MEDSIKPLVIKGTYCLIIHLKKSRKIRIGALGEINFKKGYYVYIGSALNSLIPRINRHLAKSKKIHWHVDYLLKNENVVIEDIIFNIGEEKIECELAQILASQGQEILNFGSTDCKCSSHLIFFKSFKSCKKIVKKAYINLNIIYHDLKYFEQL